MTVESATQHGLGTRTVRGMLWAYGSYVGGRMLVLVSTAILARMLTPSDFGVVALALTFMTFLETVKDLGLTQALIGSGEDHAPERTQTVFVWSVAIGAVLAVVAAACSPLAASFFGHDSLKGLVPVLAANFFVQSLGATHDSLARKALDYRTRTMADMGDVVIRGGTGIVLALLGFGAWSLVFGYLIGSIVRCIVLWWKVPWRPQRRFSRAHLRDLATFGGVLTLVDIGAAIAHNIDYLFVGRVLGSAQLGLYTIAYRLPLLIIMNLAIVAGDVLFPAYAALDRGRLQEGFLTTLRYIGFIVMPMGAVLVVLARPVVAVLFGDQWNDSVEPMQILAVYGALATLNIPAGVIYKVTRRAKILVFSTIPYLIALFAALMVTTSHGIDAVALTLAVIQVPVTVIMLYVATRVLDVPVREIPRALAAPLAVAAGMVACMLPVERLIDAPLPALLLGGLCGALAAAVLLWILARDVLLRLRRLALPGRYGEPVAAGSGS